MPAFELIDFRISGKPRASDVIADGVLANAIVLGRPVVPVTGLDLSLEGVVYEENGERVATAAAAEVLGNPLNSLAWLAKRARRPGGQAQGGRHRHDGLDLEGLPPQGRRLRPRILHPSRLGLLPLCLGSCSSARSVAGPPRTARRASVEFSELKRRLDAALSRRPRRELSRSDLISAAVLLPITAHPPEAGEPHILFTKKSADVPHHKGQFSFPGGIVEERDGSRVETALREAWEEIRLPPDAVEVLGLLDDTATRATPFIITRSSGSSPAT